MVLKAIIIDDEPMMRNELRHMLRHHPQVAVECEAGTIARAQKILSENRFDVVFLDIQLRGGTGFDLIPYIHHASRIIFITAFDEFAIRAFDVNALDYILKPLSARRLAQSIDRLVAHPPPKPVPKIFRPEDHLMVTTDTGHMFVPVNTINAVSNFGGNYTTLHLQDKDKHICRKTFKEWEKILPQTQFIRIHRSAIINMTAIKQVAPQKDGSCFVHLHGQNEPFTARRGMIRKLKSKGKSESV